MSEARTTLLLSRHGRTAWSQEGRYTGVSDIDLDAEGARQAAELAAWARAAAPERVVSSPQRRARRTAEAAAQVVGVKLEVDERLRELDFGVAEGRHLDDLRAADPGAVARFETDPVAHHLPDGESPVAAAERVTDGLLAAAARAPGSRVLVVGHNTALRLALCRLLGIPLAAYRRALPRLDHGALTVVEVGPGGSALTALNVPLSCADQPRRGGYDAR